MIFSRAAASAGLTLEPGSAPANLALARALDASGDHDGAVARYRRFLGLDPNAKEVPEVRARLAEIEGDGAQSRK